MYKSDWHVFWKCNKHVTVGFGVLSHRNPEVEISQDLSSPRKKAFIERLKSCLYYTCFTVNGQQTRCCVTAYSKHRRVTLSHRPHASFQVGSIVPIYAVNDDSKFEAKVFHVDNEMDYVLLQCEQDICSIELGRTLPYDGEQYIQIALSASSATQSPFSVSRGVFPSSLFNKKGHLLGSAGSNPGDSGGGCFAENLNVIYGINRPMREGH